MSVNLFLFVLLFFYAKKMKVVTGHSPVHLHLRIYRDTPWEGAAVEEDNK